MITLEPGGGLSLCLSDSVCFFFWANSSTYKSTLALGSVSLFEFRGRWTSKHQGWLSNVHFIVELDVKDGRSRKRRSRGECTTSQLQQNNQVFNKQWFDWRIAGELKRAEKQVGIYPWHSQVASTSYTRMGISSPNFTNVVVEGRNISWLLYQNYSVLISQHSNRKPLTYFYLRFLLLEDLSEMLLTEGPETSQTRSAGSRILRIYWEIESNLSCVQ